MGSVLKSGRTAINQSRLVPHLYGRLKVTFAFRKSTKTMHCDVFHTPNSLSEESDHDIVLCE